MSPPDTCAFCNKGPNSRAGTLQRTPDGRIVAHYNCMLYSPLVISNTSQEETQGFDFNIKIVRSEIKRGQKLNCSFCGKKGATVGCDIKSCRKNYHFPCLEEAGASPSPGTYVVHCVKHKSPTTANEVTQNVRENEQSEVHFLLPIDSTIEIEEEEALPSMSGQHTHCSTSIMRSGTSSEESDSILDPKVKAVFSLSGLPKRKKKYSSNRKPNAQLEEILPTLSSQEKIALSQMYSELGGSQHTLNVEISPVQDNQNEKMTSEDSFNSVDSDMTICSGDSEIKKTPERLPGINLHVNPSKGEHFTGELPVRSRDGEILNRTSEENLNPVISKLKNISAKSPCSNINDKTSSAKSIDKQASEFSNDTCRPIIDSVSSSNITVTHPLGLSNDIRLPTQQIHCTNSNEKLPSQPTNRADHSNAGRPYTSVARSLNFFNEQPAKDLEAQETSDTHPSGYSVTVPESNLCSPHTLEKDRNKTEKMEHELSASQDLNILAVTSPSNVETFQNEKKGHNKVTTSNIVDKAHLADISRKLVTGFFSEYFKSMVPQIQSSLCSPKINNTKDAKQSRKDKAIAEGSPSTSTKNQLWHVGRYEKNQRHLPKTLISQSLQIGESRALLEERVLCLKFRDKKENLKEVETQKRSDIFEVSKSITAENQTAGNYLHETSENQGSVDPMKKKVLVYQEREESTTSKRKRFQDFDEVLPTMKIQRTEENVPEQLEMPEELDEYYSKENELLEEAAKSGPSRVDTAPRRGLQSPLHSSKSRTEENVPEQLEIPEEQEEYHSRENEMLDEATMSEFVHPEHASEQQSGPSSVATAPIRGLLQSPLHSSKSRSSFHHVKVRDLDNIDGFGLAVADQGQRMPQDRTEENVPEQLEMPEEQVEYNFRENELLEKEAASGLEESDHASEQQSWPSRVTTSLRRGLESPLHSSKSRTEENVPEQLEMPKEQEEYHSRENEMLEEEAASGLEESVHASEQQSWLSRMTTSPSLESPLHSRKIRSSFHLERIRDVDDIDGFGLAVAGQCRRLPQDRQAKYMSYVLASADLFHAPPTLPELDILITNLQTVLKGSQQSPGRGIPHGHI
ncbi:PHD finger protein 11 [Rhinoderma darwinii]|uniref:PHD finger protein 11 n=1 Tax=Rhinoderma darwinii TaxID=43563 RepID=UPI003F681307